MIVDITLKHDHVVVAEVRRLVQGDHVVGLKISCIFKIAYRHAVPFISDLFPDIVSHVADYDSDLRDAAGRDIVERIA